MPNKYSILQNTFLRAVNFYPKGIVNVTSGNFLFKVKKEWSELKQSIEPSYILEPFGKNTAAAIAMSCLWIAKKASLDELLLILPSDHLIANQEEFGKAISQAKKLALQNKIVTFGIVPNAPETGYGYIKYDNNIVSGFVEKPSYNKALEYLKSGEYLWNSGMFCFKAGVMLEEMAKYCPDILLSAQECFEISDNINNILSIDADSFQKVRADSIDYAVLEKSDRVSVVPCDIGWSDIGDWNALGKIFDNDINSDANANGNIINSLNNKVVTENVTNSYIEGSDRLIAAVGIDNLIIVDTPDALLVANKNNAQDVKNIYNKLAKSNHQTHEEHLKVHRPWGSYIILEESGLEDSSNFEIKYKVKRIEVYPGASLSLQSHQHRSEHWVVVAGQAVIINGQQELLLNANQSVYINAGTKHRLSNSSDSDNLIIIEVQTGKYLGEDDIERFEDVYNRR